MSGFPVDLMIRLRILYNQIHYHDLDTILFFHKQMIKKFGPNIFMSSLCTDFYITKHGVNLANSCFPIKDQQYIIKMTDKIEYAIDILNKIIKKKQSTNKNCQLIPELIKPINIHQLPTMITGKIASYLQQLEYISYSTTCREIYIACNAPNKLIKLSILNAVPFEPIIGILRFRNVEQLSLTMKQCLVAPKFYKRIDEFPIFKKVKYLCLDNEEHNLKNYSFINNMISNNIICNKKIKQISLRRFGEIKFQQLMKLLSNLNKIEFLEFECCMPIPPKTAEEIQQFKEQFPLTGFSHYLEDEHTSITAMFANFIIKNYQDTIKTLKLPWNSAIGFQRETNFPKLKNLYLWDPEQVIIKKLLNKQIILNSLSLDFDLMEPIALFSDDKFSDIFIQQRIMNQFTFKSRHSSDFHFICNIIEEAINKSNRHQTHDIVRKEIEMNLIIGQCSDCPDTKSKISLDTIVIKLTRILNEILLFSFTQKFILRFEYYGEFDGDLRTEIQRFKNKYHNKIEIFNKTKTILSDKFIDINLIIINKTQ